MVIDLHTHSTASDGSDPPARVMRLAAEARLRAVALTDHDTNAGILEADAAARDVGIELVPGTEISVEWSRGGMHLVVLFLAPGPGPLQDRLGGLQVSRANRNEKMAARLQELGFDITYEEILAEAGGEGVGRPHFAAVMVRKGYVPDIATAFEEWLAAGRPAYLGRDRLTPTEAIVLARQSNAVPVLAHPHTMGLDNSFEVADTLEWLAGSGLIGLECYYSAYSSEQRAGYVELARRFQLIPSGGSDYHGSYKTGISIGSGGGDLAVPDGVLEELRSVRP